MQELQASTECTVCGLRVTISMLLVYGTSEQDTPQFFTHCPVVTRSKWVVEFGKRRYRLAASGCPRSHGDFPKAVPYDPQYFPRNHLITRPSTVDNKHDDISTICSANIFVITSYYNLYGMISVSPLWPDHSCEILPQSPVNTSRPLSYQVR